MGNDEPWWGQRQDLVRVEGALRDCRTVQAGDAQGLTATVQGSRGRYGEAYHVTFPPTRDLDLWVGAVLQAWGEAQASRVAAALELPEWMRPAPERLRGELTAVVAGQLRCGKPIPPTGVRPATVLAERVQFPGLDAAVICRAEELWQRARAARGRMSAQRIKARQDGN